MREHPLKAQVTAGFSDQESRSLVIEGDTQPHGDGLRHLLLFPSLPVSLATDVGTVVRGSTRPIDVPGGILQFSGGNTASLPREPVYSTPMFTVLFAFGLDGNPIGGETGGLSPHYDATTREVRVNRACHAAIAYTAYRTSALELAYTPLRESVATTQAGLAGMKETYGVVAAFHQPSRALAIFQVPLSSLPGEVDLELYRIVSYVVTTPDGEFEMPPGYPTSGTYPNTNFVLDLSTHLRTERVHEIGKMDARGNAFVTEFNRENQKPYFGTLYKPTKLLMASSVPQDRYGSDIVLKAKNIIKARGLMKL